MTAFYTSEDEIEVLTEAFVAKTLEKDKWTHAAHLTIAVWHLKEFDYDEAVALVRKRITEYNLAVGTQNTATSGYHETMTIFWMTVVHFFVRRVQAQTTFEVCNLLLAGPLASNTLPFYFYERVTIFIIRSKGCVCKAGQGGIE